VPGAEHHFLPELRDHARSLDRDKPTIVYCDSGYRPAWEPACCRPKASAKSIMCRKLAGVAERGPAHRKNGHKSNGRGGRK